MQPLAGLFWTPVSTQRTSLDGKTASHTQLYVYNIKTCTRAHTPSAIKGQFIFISRMCKTEFTSHNKNCKLLRVLENLSELRAGIAVLS
jgi:hypothetical protein